MKKLILLLFALFPVLLLSQTQTENYIKTTTYQVPFNGTTYSNYSYSNVAVNLVNSDFVYSGNNVTCGSIVISNNLLAVNFNGSWSPQYMKLGIIKTLTVSPALPKIELGPILSSGVPTGYFAKIENNNLIVYSSFFLNAMVFSASSYFPGYSGGNFSISTGTPMNCSGGASGSIIMSNGNLTLNPSAGWGGACNIKTGPIVQLPSPIVNKYLGVIKDQYGNDTKYGAKIDSNWLVYYPLETVPPLPASGNINFTLNLGVAKQGKTENITYFDGLGRPIQEIAKQQSSSGKDIINHIQYDNFGRQPKDYLPYASYQTNSNYINPTSLVGNIVYQYEAKYSSTNPFSETKFEPSPLNRVLQQAAPGNDWSLANNHTIKAVYQTNLAADLVKQYNVSLIFTNNTYNPILSQSTSNGGYYNINKLYKTIIKDENWTSGNNNTTVEFKDKKGRIILKRTYANYENPTQIEVKHDTYYVYDIYGNLTYVIPPLVANVTTQLNDLCYQYKYDYRNRLVEKKLPGKQWEFIVYDKLDRVIATGPAISPFSDFVSPNNLGWLITKYDGINRPILTGWMQASTVTSADRQAIQNERNSETVNISETKLTTTNTTVNGVLFRYSNVVWPTSTISTLAPITTPSIYHVLTINYYDNYNYPYGIFAPSMVLEQPVYTNCKGLLTGSWIRDIETSVLYKNEMASIFYDHKYRPIQSYTTNYLGGSNQLDTYFDFSGKTLYTVSTKKRTSVYPADVIREDYTYSDQNRLLTHTHKMNALPTQLLASYSYDELGQLISKQVGNTITKPLQKVDYDYNIRGWMTQINSVNSVGQGPDPKDLFAFEIGYNIGINKLYNGNISQTTWSSDSDSSHPLRTYIYNYDGLSRLRSAIYQKSGTFTNSYNESLTYDKNGNIKTLSRNGNSDVTATGMDNLVYTYGASNTNNQLFNINDSSNKISGFIDVTNTQDYFYDANGNMTRDLNKGIGTAATDGITYNHLNLPTKITYESGSTSGNIAYIYNALGEKVKKTVTQLTPTANTTTTYYMGGAIYVSGPGQLQYLPTSEGYMQPGGGSYEYVFQYKDHLGNIRLSYKDANKDEVITSSEIIEESNFYPFGLKHSGYNGLITSTSAGQKFKFEEQERQDDKIGDQTYQQLNWDSFKWRNYDPAMGRFMSVDPLAEKYSKWTPYAFAGNQVVSSRELEGLEPDYDHSAPGFEGGEMRDEDMRTGTAEGGGEFYGMDVVNHYKGAYDQQGQIDYDSREDSCYLEGYFDGPPSGIYGPSYGEKDQQYALMLIGVIAAPIFIAEGALAAGSSYLWSEAAAAFSQMTWGSAFYGILSNTASQAIVNVGTGNSLGDINATEAIFSALPGIGPTIAGETFNLPINNIMQGKFTPSFPKSFDQGVLQIGGGLLSNKFGNKIGSSSIFSNGVGRSYGKIAEFSVETGSNALPNLAN